MKITYSQKILILTLVVFVGILTLDIIFGDLLLSKISSINDKVKQLALSTEERERNLRLKDSVINSETERTKFEEYFIGSGDAKTAEFITSLESLAKSAGLTLSIKSVGYEPVTDLPASDTVSFLRLKFNVTGKWGNVSTFLQIIENLPKVILIRGVSLQTQDKNWSADVDLAVVKLKN